jgi:hypothetical protein
MANISCARTWRRSKIERVRKVRARRGMWRARISVLRTHMRMDGKQSLAVAQTITEASERLHRYREYPRQRPGLARVQRVQFAAQRENTVGAAGLFEMRRTGARSDIQLSSRIFSAECMPSGLL